MSVSASSPWSPLRQTTFRWLWLASIASNIGTWMHEVGAGWLMTSLSASPLNVALVQVAGSLPMFFLALPAGALADIVDKRRYLLGVQLWMAVVATLLAALTLLGLTSVWLLLTLTLCMGGGTALMMPAWSATTPELVGKDELPAAVTLSSVGVNLARAVGPAIAGVLVSLVGPWLTFAVNAVSFFAVIAVLLAWRRETEPAVLPAERLFGALRAGWRYSRSSRPLQAVLARALAFFLGASAGMSLLPLIVRGELQGSATDFGLLLGCVGIGAVLGAAFLPRLREQLGSDCLVLLASLLYALVLIALALLRDLYLLVPVMLLSGAAWIAVLSSLQVAAQTAVPSWVRARALAVYILVFFGSMAAGGTLWGLVASRASIPFALLCAAALLALGLLAALRFHLPVTEAEDLAPSLHWPAPILAEGLDRERRPVVVTLEYDIDPQKAVAFQQAMEEVRGMRRRNGAISWCLVQDSENPRQWLEFFIDESWLEHLRHHQRVTRGELKIEAAARHFQTPDIDIRIRHYLKGRLAPERPGRK
ncbi:MFS transporter [Azorhizophilus paspali]|uniref:MFS transporter n=1 Tax=Azorhizophilus paspali TaxID=69963 RepID=A0ABV6SRM0_AZOPA